MFSYRKQSPALVLVLLGVAGSTFLIFGLNGLLSAPSPVQAALHLADTNATSAKPPFLIAVVLGLTVIGIAIALALIGANARIEIADGSITAFDFLGNQIARGSLGSAEILPDTTRGRRDNRTIRTDGGDISVKLTIDRYGILWAAITGKDRVAEPAAYSPAPNTFKSRGSQIRIGPDGICELDRSGQMTLQAALDQIVAMSVVRSEDSDLFIIHTTKGTIRTTLSLKRSREFGREMRRMLDSRQTCP